MAGVGGRARLEGRRPHVRPRRGGDDADAQGRAVPREAHRAHAACTRSRAASTRTSTRPNWEPRTENRILFVGRVTGEKQIDVLLRALTLLPAELDAKVEIVGGGDQKRNLEHLAAELGIADRVTFTRLRHRRRAARGLPPRLGARDAVDRRAAEHRDDGGDGLGAAGRRRQRDGAAAPRARRRERLPLRAGQPRRPRGEAAARCSRRRPRSTARSRRARSGSSRAHDIQRTISTFESLYRGKPVTDPVTDVAPAALPE